MNYEQIDQLTNSVAFQGRVRACCTQEAVTFQSDTRPDIVALAEEVLRNGGPVFNFVRMVAAFPGLSPSQGPAGDEGMVDQATIPDAEILAQVQHHWPTVAALFWDESGNRIPT
jgi:hypothetical protein